MLICDPFKNLTPLHYSVVLADPPWYFKNFSEEGEEKNPVAHYDCMELADIQALPVSHLMRGDAVCIMWATAPMLPHAIETMQKWGFTFKSAGAWAKLSSTGTSWAFGTGYCYRSAAEFWLLGTIGSPRQKVRNVRNLIVAPIREHSRKPDEMHVNIERMWDGPYLELFARAKVPDWDSWGNQTDKFNQEERP